jgi:hypothetical protein
MKFKNLRETLKCNSPRRTPGERKKFVVKACDQGQEKIVRFGDPVMKIKKSIAARKKSYCARSGGIKGGNGKLSANFWSRKAWEC